MGIRRQPNPHESECVSICAVANVSELFNPQKYYYKQTTIHK